MKGGFWLYPILRDDSLWITGSLICTLGPTAFALAGNRLSLSTNHCFFCRHTVLPTTLYLELQRDSWSDEHHVWKVQISVVERVAVAGRTTNLNDAPQPISSRANDRADTGPMLLHMKRLVQP